jgi:hypothetical protein
MLNHKKLTHFCGLPTTMSAKMYNNFFFYGKLVSTLQRERYIAPDQTSLLSCCLCPKKKRTHRKWEKTRAPQQQKQPKTIVK